MSFKWEIYSILNPDLLKAGLNTKQQLERHYLLHGKKENRHININQAYPDFDTQNYKKNNIDLKHMNNQQLELHWLKYGRYENRQYKTVNNDVVDRSDIYDGDINKLIIDKFDNINYYKKFNIYQNLNSCLKNHILIISNNSDVNKLELLLNIKYIVISNTIDYKYKIDPKSYYNIINDIEYVVFDDNEYHNNTILHNITNYHNLYDFINKKTILFQICIPNFDNHVERFKNNYNSWNVENIWIVRFDEYLAYKFISDNYINLLVYTLKLVYSTTYKTDIIRCCLLYKYGGLYVDLSVKLINYNFLNMLKQYDLITARDDEHPYLLNGFMFYKNNKSSICEYFIKEIMSGVINEYIHENNNKSLIFQKTPSHDGFFYGPDTLNSLYNKFKNQYKSLILKCTIIEHITNTSNSGNNEFVTIVKDLNNVEYVQIKYIGYYKDLEINNSNKHYTYNNKKGLHFYSILEIFDCIFIHNKSQVNPNLVSMNKIMSIKDNIVSSFVNEGLINDYNSILVIFDYNLINNKIIKSIIVKTSKNNYDLVYIYIGNTIIGYILYKKCFNILKECANIEDTFNIINLIKYKIQC